MSGVSFQGYTQQPTFQGFGLFNRKETKAKKAEAEENKKIEDFYEAIQPFEERIKGKPIEIDIKKVKNSRHKDGYFSEPLKSTLTKAAVRIGQEKFDVELHETQEDSSSGMYPDHLTIGGLNREIFDYSKEFYIKDIMYTTPEGQTHSVSDAEHDLKNIQVIDKFVKAIKNARDKKDTKENPMKNNSEKNDPIKEERDKRRKISTQNAIKVYYQKPILPEARDFN